MALYIKFVSRAPSLPNVSVDYPYVKVVVRAYTTSDFQGGTEIANWTLDVVTFTGTTPRTGNSHTAFGDIPDARWGVQHDPNQHIDGTLDYSTTYNFQAYVEGHSVADGAGVATSGVYEFTTESAPLPGKPITPYPADEASNVTLDDTTATWVSGGNTDSYSIYYGTLSGFLVLVEEEVTDLFLDLVVGNFSVYGRISYWRVDAVNTNGTTAGDEWYFTTMLFDPVLPTGITLDHSGGAGGVPTGTATGENNMITVRRLIAVARNKIFYET